MMTKHALERSVDQMAAHWREGNRARVMDQLLDSRQLGVLDRAEAICLALALSDALMRRGVSEQLDLLDAFYDEAMRGEAAAGVRKRCFLCNQPFEAMHDEQIACLDCHG